MARKPRVEYAGAFYHEGVLLGSTIGLSSLANVDGFSSPLLGGSMLRSNVKGHDEIVRIGELWCGGMGLSRRAIKDAKR
jgi:hypothetical protein